MPFCKQWNWEMEFEKWNWETEASHIVRANCFSTLDCDYLYAFEIYLSSNSCVSSTELDVGGDITMSQDKVLGEPVMAKKQAQNRYCLRMDLKSTMHYLCDQEQCT